MPDNQPDESGMEAIAGPGRRPDGETAAEEAAPAKEAAPEVVDTEEGAEAELLAAFSRLAPAGSHRWNFEESMSRLNPQPPPDPSAVLPPWGGLPDDLWARGRSAQVGQRMMGDVVAALADVLAADSRAATAAALGGRVEASRQQFTAAWDALRYLAARVDRLEQPADVVSRAVPGHGPARPRTRHRPLGRPPRTVVSGPRGGGPCGPRRIGGWLAPSGPGCRRLPCPRDRPQTRTGLGRCREHGCGSGRSG